MNIYLTEKPLSVSYNILSLKDTMKRSIFVFMTAIINHLIL